MQQILDPISTALPVLWPQKILDSCGGAIIPNADLDLRIVNCLQFHPFDDSMLIEKRGLNQRVNIGFTEQLLNFLPDVALHHIKVMSFDHLRGNDHWFFFVV